MGRTNACKAQQKRERNTKKGTSAKANSQLKANQACMTLRCEVCMVSKLYLNSIKIILLFFIVLSKKKKVNSN